MVYYYGDLSSSSRSSSSSEDEGSNDEDSSSEEKEGYSDLWSSCIVHLDIDCFYCQCEEIDRDLRKNPRPLAIGQKHIIVTSNYEARRYGVKKLQLREDAMAACPSLWIVEGSDLQNYKRYSRAVYEAFRRALQEIAAENGVVIPVRKGCMDEMMADLSFAVNRIFQSGKPPDVDTANHTHYHTPVVFGDSAGSTELVEDQTGQTTVVSYHHNGENAQSGPSRNLPLSRRNVHEAYGVEEDRQTCIRRLALAAELVSRICRSVFDETGFYTTAGISVSPLLAKLASDLNKPKAINLLYPWRSANLIYSMPLRKMQSVGHRTMKALEGSIPIFSSAPTNCSSGKKEVKTVLDLLQVPHDSIVKSLQNIQAFHDSGSSTEQCNILLQRCRGMDTTQVIDDEGGLAKTVSVENSFRRGTVRSLKSVQHALDDLLRRLPLLVNDRTSWAHDAEKAYPTTIRVTIRMVDRSLEGSKRRPFVTKSRQSPMANGKALIQKKDDPKKQSTLLQRLVTPLLDQLLTNAMKANSINVTRLNIAVANFQDTLSPQQPISSGQTLLSGSLHKRGSSIQSQNQTPTKRARVTSEPVYSQGRYAVAAATRPVTPFNKSNRRVDPRIRPNEQQRSTSSVIVRQSNKMKATRIDNFFQRK